MKLPEAAPRSQDDLPPRKLATWLLFLRAGALPAPVVILENRTVGPSLGKDSIEKGISSILFWRCFGDDFYHHILSFVGHCRGVCSVFEHRDTGGSAGLFWRIAHFAGGLLASS